MSELVAIDLGGTHVRFALGVPYDGRFKLGEPVTLKSGDYAGITEAWAAFEKQQGAALPKSAALSVAGPVVDGVARLTNLPWRIDRAALERELGLDALVLVNDFEAVGHAVAQAGPDDFQHLCGPEVALPGTGTITIVGPGTGLGVAQLWRGDGEYRVVPSEGGHIGFAPGDDFEVALFETLRRQFGRVAAERVAAGPGISDIYQALGGEDGPGTDPFEDRISGPRDRGHDRWRGGGRTLCMCLAVCGRCYAALAHGAAGVVIAGGVGRRLRDFLPASGFGARFVAKGRFSEAMKRLPVKIITLDEPGLVGAAAVFARTA